ncbi:unnamed protein product [Pseudo-nitzschia multistriata]|uniref:Uncharacterized protein n=1 Tax=Pseudo-nitzschia multistriata TaxID=183589 RepID=A0A448Z2R7_9STRA|nr:unnamed protein product [Pseudo-nitzschia multistriata]
MLSSEHEVEIKRFNASGMEDRKQNRVKESPRATRDQENVTDEDCKGCTKRRAPQCDHSVLEDKTSSFQNKSYAEETVRIQRAQFGTEQSRLGNAEDPEFKFQPNSAIKSTRVDFDEVVTNNDFCDSNHSGNDAEDLCQARAPDCTPLILPHSLELSSTDESEGAHHPPIFTENFKLASDTPNRLSDGPDEDVRDNSRKLHFHAQYTKKETPKEQIISSLVHYSDIPRDQNCESVSFLTFEDTRSDKSFKRSSFGDFLKPDTIEVVEDLVMGAHNQLHTSLAYINSESDDSDEVPIPPPTKPRKVEPCQDETTSTTKKDQKVTLCTDDVIDLSELSDQNAWAAFDSNITFHEETRIHSHFKDNTFDHNRTKSKKVENSSPKRVEFREISNTSMKTKFKSWANFESNEIVRTQYRESVIQNENKKEIKNLEVGDTMTPKRVQPTRKSNVDRECDSPEDNGPMEKKERRKTPRQKRNVQNHACSTLENDTNKDLPNAFLSDFAAVAIPNQEIVLERPFGGDSSESRKNKDLPSNPSALGTSSNYKKDFKSGQKKGIPQNKIRNEECTNIDVKSQEIVKTGVRGHAPELIQEKELMGSQANAYFESLLLNKSSSSCVHEDKIFKNVSSQEAHQSSSDDEAYFENLLLKKTSSPLFDDDSCYRNFRSENAPNGEKFYPRAETSNKQECKEHSFEAAEISLSIDHQPLSNRQTRKEMSSLGESYGHISWEQFASNFSHNADVEDSPLRESNAHQKVNNNLSNVKDKNKLELNQSPLTSNKDTDKREETTNSSDWHNENSQDFLLMKEFSSAGQVGGIAFVETNNRCVPHVGERVLPENQLERKNRVSGKFHDEDIVARDELETKFSNLNLHSISSIRNPANIASEERKGSNIYRRDERASADDKGRFHYAQGLSSESDVIELSSEKDNCIKLEDSNSIRDHRQGIRDFLENRGNLRGEHFGRSQHRSEFTQVVEVQQDNKPTGGSDPLDSQNTIQHQEIRNFSKQQKRDSLQHHLEQSQHLNKQSQAENLDWEEALSEKLDQYEAIHANRHQESIDFQHMEDLSDRESAQPQDLNEVPRRDSIERKDSPSELHDHFEALNAYLAEYERGGKQPKDSSERNNGMGHSCQTTHTTDQHNHFEDILGDYNRDQESKKSTSVLSDTHLVETVTIENGEAGNRYSHDVSWPTNTEDSRRVPENQIGRDMGDEALNDFVMPSGNDYAHSNLYNNDSEEGVDTTTYNHSNGVLDSTGHLQHQDQNQYIHDRRHVVRILDRSLLDLDEDGDEDECLDAIEVERQNTYCSNDRDPDADTPCASNRMDPPDPLPAHRYPEGRRLSTPIPTPNDLAEAPEGATKEEIDLLNRFIDVASSDFGGQILAPESEARVRSAALKVGLTPKFVDQLLNTTMKPSENHEKNLAFVAPPELQEQQPSLYDGKNNYHNNDYSYSHQFDGDYGGDNETYNTADYSRSYAKQSRRSGYEDGNCNTNIWEFLGQNLVHLANVTAKTCGVNYHRNDRRNNRRYRDDGDSIVSAISWDGDHARSSSTSRRDRSRRRSREADDWEAADLVPEENSDCRQKEERTRHVTFEDHVDEQSYNPVVRNESPPREKITQLV